MIFKHLIQRLNKFYITILDFKTKLHVKRCSFFYHLVTAKFIFANMLLIYVFFFFDINEAKVTACKLYLPYFL